MRNWKTNLGGALHTIGTTLMGIGLVPGSTDIHAAEQLKWVVTTGFILNAIGGGAGLLFAQDSTPDKIIPVITTDTKTETK